MEGGEHVKLLPVNLKAWEKSHEFRIVQLVPSDRPICSRSNRDDAFAETARLIRRIADTILALRTPITGDLDETSP